MVSKSYSMGLFGMQAFLVEVETDISAGLPAFDLVGLPDAAVKESRNRVRAALKNCGFDFPVSHITMNLAPADRRKEGPIYDLPLLISLLKVTGQLGAGTESCVFVGELSLSGALRPVRGVLSMAMEAKRLGFKHMFVPLKTPRRARWWRGFPSTPSRMYSACSSTCADESRSSRLYPESPAAPRAKRRRTSPTCADRHRQSARSKSPRAAATTCC